MPLLVIDVEDVTVDGMVVDEPMKTTIVNLAVLP